MRARILALSVIAAILAGLLWRLSQREAPPRELDLRDGTQSAMLSSEGDRRDPGAPAAPAGPAEIPPPHIAADDGANLADAGPDCITGVVVDWKGGTVPNAVVVAYHTDPPRRGAEQASSDDLGQFAVCQLGPGTYRVSASAPRYNASVVEHVQPGTKGLTLALEPSSSISGRVIDLATGAPIAKFQVALLETPPASDGSDWRELVVRRRVRWMDNNPAESEPYPMLVRAEDGSFTVYDVPSGRQVAVAVRADGYAPAYKTVEPIPAGEQAAVTVALAAGGRIEGIVAAEDGSAVEGASIYLGETPETLVSTSDAAGAFALADLIPGTSVLSVKHAEFERAAQTVEVHPGTTSTVRVTLNRGGTIEGTVRIGEQPAVSRVVRVMNPLGAHSLDLPTVEVFTDRTGHYRVAGLSPGEFVVVATDVVENGETRWLRQEASVDGGGVTVVDFRFPAQSAAIEGVVTVRGGPPHRAQVDGKVRSGAGERTFRVEADESGYFHVAGLPGGAAQLEVTVVDASESSHRQSAAFYVPENAVVRQDFSFDGAATIGGSVANLLEGEVGEALLFDAETELRLDRIEELLALHERPLAQTELTASGAFSLGGVPPGVYKLVIFTFRPEAGEAGNALETLRAAFRDVTVESEGVQNVEIYLGNN